MKDEFKIEQMVNMLFMLDGLPKETLKRMGKPLQEYIFDLESKAEELKHLKRPHTKHDEFTVGCEQCLESCVNQLAKAEEKLRAQKSPLVLEQLADARARLHEIGKIMRAHGIRITVTSGTRWVLNLIESAANLRLKDWRERGERPLQKG